MYLRPHSLLLASFILLFLLSTLFPLFFPCPFSYFQRHQGDFIETSLFACLPPLLLSPVESKRCIRLMEISTFLTNLLKKLGTGIEEPETMHSVYAFPHKNKDTGLWWLQGATGSVCYVPITLSGHERHLYLNVEHHYLAWVWNVPKIESGDGWGQRSIVVAGPLTWGQFQEGICPSTLKPKEAYINISVFRDLPSLLSHPVLFQPVPWGWRHEELSCNIFGTL